MFVKQLSVSLATIAVIALVLLALTPGSSPYHPRVSTIPVQQTIPGSVLQPAS